MKLNLKTDKIGRWMLFGGISGMISSILLVIIFLVATSTIFSFIGILDFDLLFDMVGLETGLGISAIVIACMMLAFFGACIGLVSGLFAGVVNLFTGKFFKSSAKFIQIASAFIILIFLIHIISVLFTSTVICSPVVLFKVGAILVMVWVTMKVYDLLGITKHLPS